MDAREIYWIARTGTSSSVGLNRTGGGQMGTRTGARVHTIISRAMQMGEVAGGVVLAFDQTGGFPFDA
jgi:hypothetical protein